MRGITAYTPAAAPDRARSGAPPSSYARTASPLGTSRPSRSRPPVPVLALGPYRPRCWLSLRPATRRAWLEDREPLDRRVVRAALGGESLHAGILDAEFLVQEGDLSSQAIVVGLEPDPRGEMVVAMSARDAERDVGDRDGVDYRRADTARPALRSLRESPCRPLSRSRINRCG
jgi:hypothetical protein